MKGCRELGILFNGASAMCNSCLYAEQFQPTIDRSLNVPTSPNSLTYIYEDWDGYRGSLIRAVAPLTAGQLAWRAAFAAPGGATAPPALAVRRSPWRSTWG